MARPKIAVLLPNLHPGGAERMRIQMAGAWLAMDIDVEFILLRKEGALLSSIPAGVVVEELGVAHFRSAMLPLVAYLRRRRPTVLLAALWPLTVVAALASKLAQCGTRVVVSEHSILSLAYANAGAVHRAVLRSSLAVGYRLADARIGVSAGTVADVSRLSLLAPTQFHVVHNPAALGSLAQPTTEPAVLAQVRGPLVLSVGTLKAVKNHALLVDAFARLDPRLGATLCILGEGNQRNLLERQVHQLGLRDRVLLPGFQADTSPFYARASVFVLSSNHEGFGNVLVEALERGIPVVSTDCPAGPREILAGGEYGRLVPVGDAAALSRAISAAIVEQPDREKLKARARDFLVETVARRYASIMFPGWTGPEQVGNSPVN